MTVRLPADLHDRLTQAADRVGISANAMVNDAIEATVARIEAAATTPSSGMKARSAYADVIARLGGDTP